MNWSVDNDIYGLLDLFPINNYSVRDSDLNEKGVLGVQKPQIMT